jgi:hypothetical protein
LQQQSSRQGDCETKACFSPVNGQPKGYEEIPARGLPGFFIVRHDQVRGQWPDCRSGNSIRDALVEALHFSAFA